MAIRRINEEPGTAPHGRAPKRQLQLHDLILTAAHRACDTGEFVAASELLASVEVVIKERSTMPFDQRRHALDQLVAAHERLFMLRRDQYSVVQRFKIR